MRAPTNPHVVTTSLVSGPSKNAIPLSEHGRACLQTIGSRRALHGDAGESCRSGSRTAGMSLPVSIGPNRCELIYNHDKQPLLELSLRICLPIKELLSTLSQLAPRVNKQANKPPRPVAKAPPNEEKRKDPDIPAKGQQPARKSCLPQGGSSSNWQPLYHPWEQSLQPQWEEYPVISAAWQEEWAPSSPQVEEQVQLLWALSDKPVSRYRKPPPAQSKPIATAPRRPEKEVRIVLPQEGNKSPQSPQSSTAIATRAVPLTQKDTKEQTESEPQEATTEEHWPPPRPGAHPKKCPVQ